MRRISSLAAFIDCGMLVDRPVGARLHVSTVVEILKHRIPLKVSFLIVLIAERSNVMVRA